MPPVFSAKNSSAARIELTPFQECVRYGLFFSPWHVAFVNYSHKNKDIDRALEICDFAMAKTKKKWRKSK